MTNTRKPFGEQFICGWRIPENLPGSLCLQICRRMLRNVRYLDTFYTSSVFPLICHRVSLGLGLAWILMGTEMFWRGLLHLYLFVAKAC